MQSATPVFFLSARAWLARVPCRSELVPIGDSQLQCGMKQAFQILAKRYISFREFVAPNDNSGCCQDPTAPRPQGLASFSQLAGYG